MAQSDGMCPLPSSSKPQIGAPVVGGVPPPAPPVAAPAPDKEIIVGEPVALLDTDMLALALPAAVGANETVSVAVWLGVSIVPALTPLALKAPAGCVTPEIVTSALPVFVSVTFCELLLPTVKLPKATLAGFEVRE